MLKRQALIELGITTLANLVVALLINILAWQFRLVSGGLTGYALLVNSLTQIPVGSLLLGFNLLLLVMAYLILGKGPGLRATYGFLSLSILLDGTRYLLGINQQSQLDFGSNLIIILILSVTMGTAVCFILAANYSVGSYSTIYMILKKFVQIKPANLFFVLDFLLALIVTLTSKLEFGILLIVNAVVAYYVVRLMLPKVERWVKSYIKASA